MAEHRRALGAARPVLAGLVLARREGFAVRRRPGQCVMLVRGVATAIDHLAPLGQVSLLRQVVGAVQFVDILGDDGPLGVLPRPLADAVAGIDRRLAVRRLGAEIGMPGTAARAGSLRQLLAMPVGALDAAKIGALADA